MPTLKKKRIIRPWNFRKKEIRLTFFALLDRNAPYHGCPSFSDGTGDFRVIEIRPKKIKQAEKE